METAVVTFGEVTEEDGTFIVPTVTAEDGEEVPMDLVVVEEDGELRIDMNATMAREMGMDPEEMLEQMAEGMGQMMEGVADAMAQGFEAMGEAMGQAMSGVTEGADEPAAPSPSDVDFEDFELEEGKLEDGVAGEVDFDAGPEAAEDPPDEMAGRTWALPGDGFPPEEILSIAAAAASFFDVDFDPDLEQLDTEQWGDDNSKTSTTRYGTAEQGYAVMQSRVEQEGFASATISATAYGLPGERELSVTWSKSQFHDTDAQLNVTLTMQAPKASLDGLGGMLDEDGEVLDVMDF
jgi:hypothetical protein